MNFNHHWFTPPGHCRIHIGLDSSWSIHHRIIPKQHHARRLFVVLSIWAVGLLPNSLPLSSSTAHESPIPCTTSSPQGSNTRHPRTRVCENQSQSPIHYVLYVPPPVTRIPQPDTERRIVDLHVMYLPTQLHTRELIDSSSSPNSTTHVEPTHESSGTHDRHNPTTANA